jgi:hypothetical protein
MTSARIAGMRSKGIAQDELSCLWSGKSGRAKVLQRVRRTFQAALREMRIRERAEREILR